MSTSLVIVALPEETDRVQKISSEKAPHMTLLYLGDLTPETPAAQIAQFVEHAVQLSEHGPFYLDVKRRGELGADKADVLFFDPRSWNLKWIKQFRGQLLQNEQIRSAYDSAEQFGAPQEWVPHLTLGYPDTPAKPLGKNGIDDYPIYSVCFDRISVWLEDSNGPEFFLEWPQRDELDGDPAIAYSNTQKAALAHALANDLDLEHHGVKGMQWGVRKFSPAGRSGQRKQAVANRAARGVPAKGTARAAISKHTVRGVKKTEKGVAAVGRGAKKAGKAIVRGAKDAHFELTASSRATTNKLINSTWEKHQKDLSRINNKSEYKEKGTNKVSTRLKKPLDPLTKKYRAEVKKSYVKRLEESANEMTNASGTRQYTLDREVVGFFGGKSTVPNTSKWAWQVTSRPIQAKHAATDAAPTNDGVETFVIAVQAIFDSDGLITKIEPVEENPPTTAAHGETFVDGLLHGSTDLGEAFILEHYGIKGMRWGQRKAAPTAVAPMATSKVPHGDKRKTQVKAEGGQNHPAHEDAIKVAQSKVKLKKSGPAALSNKELQDVANRVQLEERVAMLTSSRGKKFVRQQFRNESENLARAGVREGLRRGGPKAAKKGATTAAKIGIGAALL